MRNRIDKAADIGEIVDYYGEDILSAKHFQESDNNIQHGHISVMDHSISVSFLCIKLAKIWRIKVDCASLVRGALLHDYFCYDWHNHEVHLHGFRHADIALQNAADEFAINPIEANMIARHMFPLNIRPPKYREAIILCIADKICATREVFAKPFYSKNIQSIKK